MTEQTINTDRVASSVNKLRSVNNRIKGKFKKMKNNAATLDSNWKGSAGEAARTAMYQIFSNEEARSAILQNYITILDQQVNPDYVRAETINTSLADKFK